MRTAPGLAALADAYDGFLLDQWGVLHDGARAYSGAVDGVERLAPAGKKIVVFSNQPRLADHVLARMQELGYARALVTGVASSGEDMRAHLMQRTDPWYRRLGRRALAVTDEAAPAILDGLDLEMVDQVGDADVILLLRTTPGMELRDYEDLLAAAVARGLPAICANPDVVAPAPGGMHIVPGALAQRYRELGGDVRCHGKPDAAFVAHGCTLLGLPAEARIVVVGDNLDMDILGAEAAGYDSVFIAGGLHLEELGCAWGDMPSDEALARLFEKHGVTPTWTLPALRW